jgi:hypothetical protein
MFISTETQRAHFIVVVHGNGQGDPVGESIMNLVVMKFENNKIVQNDLNGNTLYLPITLAELDNVGKKADDKIASLLILYLGQWKLIYII